MMKTLLLFLLLANSFSCTSFKPGTHDSDLKQNVGIKIAVVNFQVAGGQSFSQHMAHIELIAQKASAENASYLLLPELTVFDLMPVNFEADKTHQELVKLAALAPRYQESLVDIGKKYKLNLIGASMVVKENNYFLNRALFINTEGNVQIQDKLRPTPWEASFKFKGASGVKFFTAPEFSFVILTCHDAEFPDISSGLVSAAPQVIFVPSMTDDQSGLNRVKLTASARAVEHMAYVLMTGTSGLSDAPWHAYLGQNHLFLPQNKYFKGMDSPVGPSNETLTFYYLDLTKLRAARLDTKQVYPARDMKALTNP